MRLFPLLATTLLAAPLAAAPAPSQLAFGDALLELRAEARACYLGFIELYDVGYFAGPGAARCIRLSYLRDFSGEALDEATVKVFAQRHGDAAVARHRAELERLGAAYRPVAAGDRYTYCVAPDSGGVLLRDGRPVLQLEGREFPERFLQIWVKSEPPGGEPEWGFGRC